jgi:hypothetical protein
MLRCTFALELRRALRMTHPTHFVRDALFGRYTAIMRGSDLAARIGFAEAKRETQVNQFSGMTSGALTMKPQTRGGRNG